MDSKPRGRRLGSRNYTDAFRQQIVREARQADRSVAKVAVAHGLNTNMVSHWLRRFGDEPDAEVQSTAFIPIEVKQTPLTLPGLLVELGELDSESDIGTLSVILAALRRTMTGLPSGTRVCLAAGNTDMRSGFNGLAARAQTILEKDPYSGHVFVFRGRSGSLLKVLWWSGDGMCQHRP